MALPAGPALPQPHRSLSCNGLVHWQDLVMGITHAAAVAKLGPAAWSMLPSSLSASQHQHGC